MRVFVAKQYEEVYGVFASVKDAVKNFSDKDDVEFWEYEIGERSVRIAAYLVDGTKWWEDGKRIIPHRWPVVAK